MIRDSRQDSSRMAMALDPKKTVHAFLPPVELIFFRMFGEPPVESEALNIFEPRAVHEEHEDSLEPCVSQISD